MLWLWVTIAVVAVFAVVAGTMLERRRRSAGPDQHGDAPPPPRFPDQHDRGISGGFGGMVP